MSKTITVETTVNQPLMTVWEKWTSPEHIVHWNYASEDWHCPRAANDLRVGGAFSSTMAAKDGSMSFDFGGVYDEVVIGKKIGYRLGDGRQVMIEFQEIEGTTLVRETFDSEETNTGERQRSGWQAIMDNFKAYAESMI